MIQLKRAFHLEVSLFIPVVEVLNIHKHNGGRYKHRKRLKMFPCKDYKQAGKSPNKRTQYVHLAMPDNYFLYVQFFHSNFWMLKKKNKSKLRTDIISSLYAPLTLRRLWTPIPLQVIIAWMIILFKPSVIAWWSDVLIAEGLLSLFIYLHFSNTAYLNNGTFSTFQGIHFNSAS